LRLKVKSDHIKGALCFSSYLFQSFLVSMKFYPASTDGAMVSAFLSATSGPGSSSGRGHSVVFLGKTLDSHRG